MMRRCTCAEPDAAGERALTQVSRRDERYPPSVQSLRLGRVSDRSGRSSATHSDRRELGKTVRATSLVAESPSARMMMTPDLYSLWVPSEP